MISVRNLTKIYKLSKSKKNADKNVVALNGVNLDFPDKGLVFLLGKSGSGKSTLLNCIGGLDTFDSGEIIIKGKSSKDFKQSDFDSYRNTFIGFIFQEYNILEEFTVGKNLALALELQGKKADKAAVEKLLEEVDLSGYYKRKPNQLSGGQKQRVAIARALIKDPEIIMADEPTGALDSNTGKQVMDTLKKLSKSKLVIIVSHDREFAEIYGDRIVELKDGNIIRDEVKKEVEAQKTASGVSFIDNKIVHIKKGQHVTKEDMLQIGKMIIENSHNSDTIISFDEKSNTEVKKTAFITDEGNREVFTKTQQEDIKRINHDPSNFKMIKSKLKFKDSFKMGASSLKHKPIRLIFTILLAVFAFGMFGVVNTMSSFNRADSTYATIEQLDIKTLVVNKKVRYNKFLINEKEFNKFQNDNKNYKFNKVIGNKYDFYVNDIGSQSSNYNNYYNPNALRISGIMAIDDETLNDLKLNLTNESSLPTNEDEICISQNLFDIIKENYSEVNSFENIKDKTLYISNLNKGFKIVGIIQDDTNIEKYKNIANDPSSQDNYNLMQEMEVMLYNSLANMCYVNQTTFDKCYQAYHAYDTNNYQSYIKGEDNYGGGYSPYFVKGSTASETTPKFIKSGYNIKSLKNNQAVVGTDILVNNYNIPADEIESKINEGLKISFSANYDEKDHVFNLEVVGYTNSGSDIYVSDEFYNDYFKGCDLIVARLKQNSHDKTIVKYFENMNTSVFNFNVQSPATPMLDNFGETIENLSKILFWVGFALAVFAGLMLMNFISTSISYKKREIGVLRAIGARGKDVFSIFFAESFIICMINFVLSSIGCGVVCTIINNVLISDLGISLTLMIFGFKQIALIFGVALLVAFISCFIPVFRFARKNPIDSINNR